MPIKGYVDSISHGGVVGWAVDTDRPDVPVEIVIQVNGAQHGRCMADLERPQLAAALGQNFSGRHEFRYSFTPALATRFDTPIVVIVAGSRGLLENGIRVLPGSTSGYASLSPVMLTSRGRSGTTMLMNEFSHHAEIVVGNTYPYEVKHAAYYAAAHRVVALPPPVDNPDFAEAAEKTWTICGNPANRPDISESLGGPRMGHLFQQAIPRRLSDLFREFVVEAYGVMAVEQGKPDPRFFAEKTSLADNVRHGIRNMFGAVREIVLIRDPRDYMCSAKAFWHHSSRAVLDLLAITMPAFEAIHQNAGPDTIFIRYEDLIGNPIDTRKHIYEFIGVAEIPTHAPPVETFDGHATSATPDASIGRWKQDLSPEELAACTRVCASYMDRFGYA